MKLVAEVDGVGAFVTHSSTADRCVASACLKTGSATT